MKYFFEGKEVLLDAPFSMHVLKDKCNYCFTTTCLDKETADQLVEQGFLMKDNEPLKFTVTSLFDYFNIPHILISMLSTYDDFALRGVVARLMSDYYQEVNACKHDKIVYVINLLDDKVITTPWMGHEKAIRVAWFKTKEEAEEALKVVMSLDNCPETLDGKINA